MTTTNGTPQVSPIAQIEALYDRLTRAQTLVANNKVHPIYGMANYYVVEGSNARYLVNGSCNCPDATKRVELTKGLCKHRLAAMVYAEQIAKAETPKATPTSEAESPQRDEELERKVADLYR
jgi:predicted nucleic acid-binding Zn finger protein